MVPGGSAEQREEQHEPDDHPGLPGLGRQSGKAAFPADLLIEGGRIRAVARNCGQLDGAGAEVIEAGGMTLMPGLVEGHAHLSFGNAVATTDLGDLPPEERTLLTARNARTLLD